MAAKPEYIEKAKNLSEEEAIYLTIKVSGRKEKTIPLEALAIQLEQEDRDLQEWRKNYSKVRVTKTVFTDRVL